MSAERRGERSEQLRRLTNTVRGVSHRLSEIGSAAGLSDAARTGLQQIASDLRQAADRLQNLLSSWTGE
jgi:hypothetical protein